MELQLHQLLFRLLNLGAVLEIGLETGHAERLKVLHWRFGSLLFRRCGVQVGRGGDWVLREVSFAALFLAQNFRLYELLNSLLLTRRLFLSRSLVANQFRSLAQLLKLSQLFPEHRDDLLFLRIFCLVLVASRSSFF